MKLSNSFTLSEMLKSNTASMLGIEEQYSPSKEVINNLTKLCKEVLQPIRDSLEMPVRVTSGYRCEKLNKAIGGSSKSQHVKGEAADVELWIRGEEKNAILLDEIAYSRPFEPFSKSVKRIFILICLPLLSL